MTNQKAGSQFSDIAGSCVLIVDDESGIRRTLRSVLQGEGYEVNECADGNEALSFLKTFRCDLIVSDVRMPGIDGIMLLEHVKHERPDVPVILMSGCADLGMLLMAVKEKAFDFILKPFNPDQIIHAVSKALLHKHLMDSEQTYRSLLVETVSKNAIELKEYMHKLQIARDQAVEASLAKTAFLASISHEIRTPLNGIVGIIDILQHREHLPEQKEYFTMLRESSDYLTELLSSLLDHARLVAGRLTLSPRSFRLSEVVDSVNRMILPKAKKKGLSYTSVISAGVPDSLYGDDLRLRQVLVNLLDNAIKYSDRGDVSLQCSVCGVIDDEDTDTVAVAFTVADTGEGIAPEHLDTIFESFSRVNSEMTGRVGGAGIGLALVREIVKLMGGSVRVRSVPGRGTTFLCEVTLKREGAEHANSYC
ncbi:MAG TPA: response regulator [Dissulfurispiraceae bacterium]|nr:response regulator [Dissulfurispiraceae bacterium]